MGCDTGNSDRALCVLLFRLLVTSCWLRRVLGHQDKAPIEMKMLENPRSSREAE